MENILKYWKVVREWMKAKHGLTQADLDMLLFLYDEGTFRQADLVKFEKLLSWDRKRQQRLMDSGWIALLVARTPKRNTTYRLTIKGKRALTEMYKRLYGEAANRARALDAIRKFNVQNTNEGRLQNLMNRQRMNERNANLLQQQFQNQMALAGAKSGALQNYGASLFGAANQDAAQAGGFFQTAGDAAGRAASYYGGQGA